MNKYKCPECGYECEKKYLDYDGICYHCKEEQLYIEEDEQEMNDFYDYKRREEDY